MQIRLDSTTRVPPFEQIRAQVTLQVAAGRLLPGDRLPTIRVLADRLDIAPNTIARAYRELITQGICVADGRRGTFVADTPPVAFDIAQRADAIGNAAQRFAEATRDLGVPIDEALEIVITALREARAA